MVAIQMEMMEANVPMQLRYGGAWLRMKSSWNVVWLRSLNCFDFMRAAPLPLRLFVVHHLFLVPLFPSSSTSSPSP